MPRRRNCGEKLAKTTMLLASTVIDKEPVGDVVFVAALTAIAFHIRPDVPESHDIARESEREDFGSSESAIAARENVAPKGRPDESLMDSDESEDHLESCANVDVVSVRQECP